MAYKLTALLISAPGVDALPQELRAVELTPELALVPLVELEKVGRYRETDPCPRFYSLTPVALEQFKELARNIGLLAYVESELHGGLGRTSSLVLDASGDVAFEAHTSIGEPGEPGDERVPPSQDSINRALVALGQRRGDALDEFEAVGLGRHRFTEEWLDLDRDARHPYRPG